MAAVRTASPPLLFALDAPDQGFVCLNSPQRRSLGVMPTTRLASRRDATFMRFFEGDTQMRTPGKKSRRLFWHVCFSLLLRSASVQTIGLFRSIVPNYVGDF